MAGAKFGTSSPSSWGKVCCRCEGVVKMGYGANIPRITGQGACDEGGGVVNEVRENYLHDFLRETGDWVSSAPVRYQSWSMNSRLARAVSADPSGRIKTRGTVATYMSTRTWVTSPLHNMVWPLAQDVVLDRHWPTGFSGRFVVGFVPG